MFTWYFHGWLSCFEKQYSDPVFCHLGIHAETSCSIQPSIHSYVNKTACNMCIGVILEFQGGEWGGGGCKCSYGHMKFAKKDTEMKKKKIPNLAKNCGGFFSNFIIGCNKNFKLM